MRSNVLPMLRMRSSMAFMACFSAPSGETSPGAEGRDGARPPDRCAAAGRGDASTALCLLTRRFPSSKRLSLGEPELIPFELAGRWL